MAWVKDINSFYDFIGYVVLYAPDRFPIEDYLPADQQMNLERAFVELRKGVAFIDDAVAAEEKRKTLLQLLDQSMAAYRSSDEVRGAHLLQDLEVLVFKK